MADTKLEDLVGTLDSVTIIRKLRGFEERIEALQSALRHAWELVGSADPFSAGRDGDMCQWCRRDYESCDSWEQHFSPDKHDADCDLIKWREAARKLLEPKSL